MDTISVRQNAPGQLQRLAAQRQLYSRAKRALGVQMILGGPVAVLTALIAWKWPALKAYVALWGYSVFLLDAFLLTPWMKSLRLRASQVQEAFDCDVLDLRWNELKAGKRPDAEFVIEQAMQYERNAAAMPELRDWYPDYDELPLHVARIGCQRVNCWWDSKQRRRYTQCVIGTLAVTCVLVVLIGMVGGLTVEEFVLVVLLPLLPAIAIGVRQYQEHAEAGARLEKLQEHAERLWVEAVAGTSTDEVCAKSRNLQDEILESRRRNPPVFDFVFKLIRSSHEEQTRGAARDRVKEAKRVLEARARQTALDKDQ